MFLMLASNLGGCYAISLNRLELILVKSVTILTVISIGLYGDCPIHQLHVNNTFLHGTLTEIVYAE
jgi:hypothetical protein